MGKLEEVKNGDLYYYGYNLHEIAKKFGTPLKVTFLDLIKDRVLNLKEAFDLAIKELGYEGKFMYLNANKANYGAEEIETAFVYADGIETSSYYDLILSHKMFERYPNFKSIKPIVSNGFKPKDYLDKIIEVHNEGYHIIDVIDSMDEYEYLKSKDVDLEIGLRIHLKSLYLEGEDDPVANDRFGLTRDEFLKIIDDLANTKMKLSIIHFHQRGFDYEKDKFEKNFAKTFEDYYVYAQKKYITVEYFDMGGGTPLPFDKEFDYKSWAKYVVGLLKKMSNKFDVKEPTLISENGKYTQKDATVNLYHVVGVKDTDAYPWYIVDGSPLIAMPETYALGEVIIVKPVNALDKDKIKGRLAGLTCDCDDIYYDKKTGYFEFPNSKEIYIGLLGTGSYQNSMNGKGGIHHCLLPEERDVIVYKDENGNVVQKVRHELQSMEDIYRLMKLK